MFFMLEMDSGHDWNADSFFFFLKFVPQFYYY